MLTRLNFGVLVRNVSSASLAAILGLHVALSANACAAQDARDAALHELTIRLDAQAAELAALRQQIMTGSPSSPAARSGCQCDAGVQRLPLVTEICDSSSCSGNNESPEFYSLGYYADYDKGFVIRAFCPEQRPFQLKVNGWIQFRHHAFARDVDSWTNNAGVTRPVRNRNAFDIERGRVVLRGSAIDKRLTYFLQLDGDTDGSHGVDFFDYWWGWQCTDRFQLQMGKRKVPASRQWLLTARHTRFIDRPMANDFFRPDRTVGLFGAGQLGANGHYEVMVGNGYRTANLPNSLTDTRLTYGATHFIDPWGDYGGELTDYQCSCSPLVRIGHSFVFSPNAADSLGVPLLETDFLRLTDGTRLTQVGALVPGVTVSDFDVYFYGIDAAIKYRGWSFNSEAFFRWIEDLQGDGALPTHDLFQHGCYVEGGRFLIPQKVDVNIRYSQVSGAYGSATEIAAGFNWFPTDTNRFKVSFDVTELDGSPMNNTASDILVGDDGTLFRTQAQAEF